LNHPAGHLEVLHCVDRAAQIAAAAISWDPANPLTAVQNSALRLHDSCLAIPAVCVSSNVDVNVGAICTVLSGARNGSSTQATIPAIAWAITTANIVMPSCCLVATTIVLSPVKLSTTTTLRIMIATRIAIVCDAGILLVGICHVEVVVHTTVSLAQVHVPSHATAI
jgi:hypothetical protein